MVARFWCGALVLGLVACGGTQGEASVTTASPAAPPAAPPVEEPPPEATTSVDTMLPGLTYVAPRHPVVSRGFDLEDETHRWRASLEIAEPEGTLDEAIARARDNFRVAGAEVGPRVLEIDGHRAVAVVVGMPGAPARLAYALTELDAEHHARITVQTPPGQDAGALLDRVVATASATLPTGAPPEGMQWVGVEDLYFAVPASLRFGEASHLFDDDERDESLRVRLVSRLEERGDPTELATHGSRGRQVTEQPARPVSMAGRSGQRIDFEVMISEETWAETIVQVDWTADTWLIIHGTRLGDDVSIDALIESITARP